jgi:hypothetical protein
VGLFHIKLVYFDERRGQIGLTWESQMGVTEQSQVISTTRAGLFLA